MDCKVWFFKPKIFTLAIFVIKTDQRNDDYSISDIQQPFIFRHSMDLTPHPAMLSWYVNSTVYTHKYARGFIMFCFTVIAL